jgi:predicted nucleic acid-binding protein
VPLLVAEATTEALEAALEDDPQMLVWWASEVECESALSRLERDGEMSEADAGQARKRLDTLAAQWNEVMPVRSICATSRRLLRTHRLRAADSLQLAAALAASEDDPASIEMIVLDTRLTDAARREGLTIIDLAVEPPPPEPSDRPSQQDP